MTIAARLSRPQPVDILPIPAGLLLLPEAGEGTAEARQQIMAAEAVQNAPATWKFYALAGGAAMGGRARSARRRTRLNRCRQRL